ncbi:MAG: hypothetical protein BWX80_03212 [Candidatus Hydrogenedentes bacterium ADurb.Bin101]|nr:MAG: hypothetical protein BWX80_03212 [Candidatus Hydrogenedentes bacterium ADurb.Bin101]
MGYVAQYIDTRNPLTEQKVGGMGIFRFQNGRKHIARIHQLLARRLRMHESAPQHAFQSGRFLQGHGGLFRITFQLLLKKKVQLPL